MTTDLPPSHKQLLWKVQIAYHKVYERDPDPEVALTDIQEAVKLILAFVYSQLGGEPSKMWEEIE